jgi:hypothetical protein
MRRTRFMSLVFLMLSAAFFFVSDFRQGLMSTPTMYGLLKGHLWMAGAIEIPQARLNEMIQTARQQHDARTLAFAAMHGNEGAGERMKLAAEATAIDPQITWIYSKVYYAILRDSEKGSPQARQALAKLESWDPGNALPYLCEGELILTGPKDLSKDLPKLDALMNETEWRNVMAKAYAAPRYDSYTDREFELDRSWLSEHHMAKPVRIILMVAAYPVPNLLNIRTYSQLLNQKLGKDAENAGRLPEALGYYWTSAHMGERMRMVSGSLIEKLIGIAIEKDAYQHLIPVLRRTGQTDEAETLQFVLDHTQQSLDSLSGKDPLEHSMNYGWEALLVSVFDFAVLTFGLLTLLSVIYVNAKRWVRPERKGHLYQIMTVAENYLPILLFISCAGLFLAYYPFAQNYHYFLTATGSFHNLEPIIYNIFPALDVVPGDKGIALTNPFLPYMWFALAGLVLAALMQIPGRKHS